VWAIKAMRIKIKKLNAPIAVLYMFFFEKIFSHKGDRNHHFICGI
jgi:hypothetical protein